MSRGPGAGRSRRVVVDGTVLVDDHFSGIGHYAMSLLQALDLLLDDEVALDVRLAVPVGRIDRLARYGLRNIRPLPIYLPWGRFKRRVENEGLPRMDRLLGRGTYVFPNYIRWPLASSRSITAIHDLSFEKVADFVDGPNAVFLRREVQASAERSDLLTALTAHMADEIAEHYDVPRQRIRIVGCAADGLRFYKRSEREVAEVTARHGIFGPYLLTVGNIEPRKNQIRLIDAFCALPRDVADDLTLVLVGAGAWREDQIRDRVAAAHRDGFKVKLLLGAVGDDDLPALYSGASCSLYVSVYEGFGMPPLESMACQTPVISSDASVLPEVTGGAAVLVDPTSTAAITEAIERVLALDPAARADLVARGLANVARYDWADAARTLVAAIDELAEA